jgi:hypothetical protein
MAINAESAMDEEVSNDVSAGPAFAKCLKREVRMGFSTGISMPGRRSTPVCSIILLQRAVYRSELGVELRADALNCCDDRKRDTGGDQAILDRGRTGFIAQEYSNGFHSPALRDPLNLG